MAYQADEGTKNKILEVLGPEQLFRFVHVTCEILLKAHEKVQKKACVKE